MDGPAVSFEVYAGDPSSATGPERLPVLVYDARERSEIRPGPLLPDVTRRVEIAARDNPDVAAELGRAAFTRICAEVIRAILTGYSLWSNPDADAIDDGLPFEVQVEFRPTRLPATSAVVRPGPHALQRHGIVYADGLAAPPSGALCWTSTPIVRADGGILTLFAYVGIPTPADRVVSPRDYPIITCQEGDALFRAMADGWSGRGWRADPGPAALFHRADGVRHNVSLELLPRELRSKPSAGLLERLAAAQDADGCFAVMYVTRLLAPSHSMRPSTTATGWVDLDGVAARVWPPPRSRRERAEQRRRVYRYLLFCERARISGVRSGRYVDRTTGAEIDARLDAPILRILDAGRPGPDLAVDLDAEPPVRVRIGLSPEWTLVTTHPRLAQYLPFGEALGAIPGGHPSGAWARAIGLALASFWRRHPGESLTANAVPTRRELLLRYQPKTAPPMAVLTGHDPGRAIRYWQGALQMLAEIGFAAPTCEAATTAPLIRRGLARYGWRDPWLDAPVWISPGPLIAPAVEAVARSRRQTA